MNKLNEIIESMALAQFKADTRTADKTNSFILKNATLGEFCNFFATRESDGKSWLSSYRNTILGSMNGLSESFCNEVLWPKLKDKYIEDVVKGLENKLESTYKITIEQL